MSYQAEVGRAEEIQRDRAHVLNPWLDPWFQSLRPVMALGIEKSRDKPKQVRWFTNAKLPRETSILFDGPAPAWEPFRLARGSMRWDDHGPCNPIDDIMRASGMLEPILGAHRLEGWPSIAIVLICHNDAAYLSRFSAMASDFVRASGETWRVIDWKVVRPSRGPDLDALLLVSKNPSAELPAVGSDLRRLPT